MTAGLNNLKHIVVLMMENRSFDHLLGGLSLVLEGGKKKYPGINGLTGNEWNPDTQGNPVKVQPNAKFQSQLDPDPDHHFPGVDLQIFGGAPPGPGRVANMQGFVKDYFTQTNDVNRSHNIMYYFTPDQLPVLTTLATQFAVFNGWFSSIPGPTICNRAFAHYGTSFGQVGMDIFYILDTAVLSIYERMIQTGHTAKIYYYDQPSSTMEIVNILRNQPQIFATYPQFIADCQSGALPDYSFIEPCYNDHAGPGGGEVLASDQHPDHNVQEGEKFMARVYNAIRTSPLWDSTALLIVYDEHGGIYDHVVPPACPPDGYSAKPDATGTGEAFHFDRLGIRVPAVLVSPYVPKGIVVPGPEDPAKGRNFEHACIPGTVTNFFLKSDAKRTDREKNASGFLDLLSDQKRPDADIPYFNVRG
jgi:phospholipase C